MPLASCKQYCHLMRLDKPIGILLLLWPTLWALWLATQGTPQLKTIFIFSLGTIFMRSAGCVINDYADRDFDRHVERTKNRPLAQNMVLLKTARLIFLLLLSFAFFLVCLTNAFTISLAFIGAILASIYPFTKRFCDFPQLFLGLAFAWGIPMAFAATINAIPSYAWLLYLIGFIWPIAYDTMYAMVDKKDDIKIGIRSTAILFGKYDKLIIMLLQSTMLILLMILGYWLNLGVIFYISLIIVTLLFCYQQFLIKDRDSQLCFKAFLNNQWVGLVIFLGIALHYLI